MGDSLRSSPLLARVFASLLALGLSWALLSFPFDGLNGVLVDSFFRARGQVGPNPSVTLIGLDAATTHGGESDVAMSALVELLDRLNPMRPKAIGLLLDLDSRRYSAEELSLLASRIDPKVPVFVGFLDEAGLNTQRETSPLGGLVQFAPGLVSRDSFNFGADSVSRRVMVAIDRTPTFYARLATFLTDRELQRTYRVGGAQHAFINWSGPAGTYPIYPIWAFGAQSREGLDAKGQVVLAGHVRRTRPNQDYVLTPYSRRLGETPQLEAAAHGLATLLEGKGLIRPPFWAVAVSTLLVGLVTVNLVSILTPLKGVGMLLGSLGVMWVLGWGALAGWGIWLDLAHPMLAALTSYYLVVPLRLGLEYRKRWHFQQQSEVLARLESLKSHFLSLVSHDLKTPIARIQGHAELIESAPDNLSPKQREQLAAILSTTQQMSDYVQTMLDLTRIESSKVPLQKESRDINAILEEAIEQKLPLAQDKGIRIDTRLEPLFNLRFDPRLMRQVIGNLIENAIKYSDHNTLITVTSEEQGAFVRIQVTDEGPGISEQDQPLVFGKFFRAANPDATKGTGLGLNLVKYFVELHGGRVGLQSTLGKGSTFSVSLPV